MVKWMISGLSEGEDKDARWIEFVGYVRAFSGSCIVYRDVCVCCVVDVQCAMCSQNCNSKRRGRDGESGEEKINKEQGIFVFC